jgi:hypothetical protein
MMSESRLNNLTRYFDLGTYQIKQAKTYIVEHIKPSPMEDDQYEFVVEVSSRYNDLVRVRFASRHSSRKKYVATVQFDEEDDDEPVKGWFCTCSAGARIIGCCAHITALIWHLGVNRGETIPADNQLSASNFLNYIDDCIQYSDIERSDDGSTGSDQSHSDEN